MEAKEQNGEKGTWEDDGTPIYIGAVQLVCKWFYIVVHQISVHQISVHQIVQNYKLTTSERKPLVPLSELNTVRYFEANYINWNIQYHHSVPDKL